MAKRVDPLKAKQAKQKKIAIVLCIFFAIVLFIQVPRTLKMLKGPQATTAAPAATTPAAPTTPAPGTSGEGIPVPAAAGTPAATAGAPTATAAAQPAVLVDSDVPAAAGEGQLRSFELFKAKDPFAQQNLPPASSAAASEQAGAASKAAATKPATGASAVAPSKAGTAPAGATMTTVPDAKPSAPAAAAPATVTSISVNGVAANVAPGATFPADSPTFVLASVATDGKSVRIGVAGGSYADGSPTIKLTLGKPLKLRNTADGSEYVLLLKSVAGFPPPK